MGCIALRALSITIALPPVPKPKKVSNMLRQSGCNTSKVKAWKSSLVVGGVKKVPQRDSAISSPGLRRSQSWHVSQYFRVLVTFMRHHRHAGLLAAESELLSVFRLRDRRNLLSHPQVTGEKQYSSSQYSASTVQRSDRTAESLFAFPIGRTFSRFQTA